MGFDPISYAMGKQAGGGGGGGGGNPNYVETVTGMLSAPWGDVDPAALHQSVLAGDANVMIDVDATALGFGHVVVPMTIRELAIEFNGVDMTGLRVESWVALSIEYYGDSGEFIRALLLQGGAVTDMSQYALLPTVLTINHHPLPEEG